VRIEIEPGEAPFGAVQGFVYVDGEPNAVYYVDHDAGRALMTVAFGEWDEGTSGADRFSVCVEWWAGGMALTEEPARESDLLGAFTPREEALALDGIDHLWDVVAAIRDGDPRVVEIGRRLAG
jgi:hypothetical protein